MRFVANKRKISLLLSPFTAFPSRVRGLNRVKAQLRGIKRSVSSGITFDTTLGPLNTNLFPAQRRRRPNITDDE